MEKVATFIVDKRKAFYLLFILSIIYSIISIPKVKINQDISTYLPDETETRVGLKIMEKEFKTFGSAQIMISNISYAQADKIAQHIDELPHVLRISFENTEKYYMNSSALIIVSFDNVADDPDVLATMQYIKDYLKDYDIYVVSEVGDDFSKILEAEMRVILIIAAIIIVGVLIFTSKSYLEILVFIIVFAVAGVLNMGTNYWFGEISFVTKSIAIILQLALAVDYAIILCHRFTEELEHYDARNAIIQSLSKAIIEISSSSLTTISGLLALTTMQFEIGMDMGTILIKGILFSLITVFLLMPGLLLMFSKGIEKTQHKNFVPKITFLGKIVLSTKFILLPIFFIALGFGLCFSGQSEYVFSMKDIDTKNKSVNRIAQDKIDATFGTKNEIAIVIPKGYYECEKQIINRIKNLSNVVDCVGLASIEVEDEKVITDKFTPRQFAELTDVDIDLSRLLFRAYGLTHDEYAALFSNIDKYSAPLIEIFEFVNEQITKGIIVPEDEQQENFDELHDMLEKAKIQLVGTEYSRIVIIADVIDESPETDVLTNEIKNIAHEYYKDVIMVGEPTVATDLRTSFSNDNIKISIMTALFVMVILLFTFRSVGLPFMLIMTIQGSIFFNFSFPYLTDTNIFFLSYLIVSSIQMGATIDYAILITNRYQQLKEEMPRNQATIESLNQAFPTIFTSGTILTAAGYLIGNLSTDPVVSSIGLALGRGTLISIILVLTVLPQILNVGDYLIEKSALTINIKKRKKVRLDEIQLNGYIKGKVNGYVEGEIKGKIQGSIDAEIESFNEHSEKKQTEPEQFLAFKNPDLESPLIKKLKIKDSDKRLFGFTRAIISKNTNNKENKQSTEETATKNPSEKIAKGESDE